MNTNYSTGILASTVENYTKGQFYNNIFNVTPTLNYFKKFQKPQTGGSKILEHIMHLDDSSAGAFARGASITVSDVEVVNVAEYDWKNYQAHFLVLDQDLLQNSGQYAMLSLLEARLKRAAEAIGKDIATDIFATSQPTYGIVPLRLMADATTTIGNIAVTDTYWVGTVNTDSEEWSLEDFNVVYMACVKKGRRPDFIPSGAVAYESYERVAGVSVYALPNNNLLDIGAKEMAYKGASMVYEPFAADGTHIMLNKDAVTWRPHVKCASSAIHEVVDSDAVTGKVHKLWLMGALTCKARCDLGLITSKTIYTP